MSKHAAGTKKSSSDSKARLSLLQAEKRFADLELGLEEVKNSVAEVREATERFKEIDPAAIQQLSQLSDMKQRLEDVEDLIMVESAGIEELKNLMQDLKGGPRGEAPAEAPGTELPEGLEEKLAALEGIEGKISAFGDLKRQVEGLENELAEMKGGLATQPSTGAQAPDLRSFAAKFEQLKSEVEAKIEELDKSGAYGRMPDTSSMSNELKKKIDGLNRKFSEINSRIESVENASKDFPNSLQRFGKKMSEMGPRIEALENVSKSMPDDLQRLAKKEVGNVSKSLSEFVSRIESVESFSKNLSENMERSAKREVSGQTSNLGKKLLELNSRVESVESASKNFLEEAQRLVKREADAINRKLSVTDSRMGAAENVSKTMSDELAGIKSSMQKFESFENASSLVKDLQNKMDEFKFIESEVKRISNRVEGFYTNLDQKLDKIREFERQFPQVKLDLEQLRDDLSKKLDENKVLILDKASKDETSEIRDRLGQAEARISDARLKDIEESVGKLRKEIKDGVSEAKEPISVMSIEMSDFMARIVTLETRLGNLENMMQGIGKVQPIILE